MAIELIALDMDGTTLTPDKHITPEGIEAVRAAREQGVKVVICSGRSLPGVARYADQLDLRGEGEYAIVQNGAAVHHLADDALLMSRTISEVGTDAVVDFLSGFQMDNIVGLTERDFLLVGEQLNDRMAFESKTLRMPAQHTTLDALRQRRDLYKLLVVGEVAQMDALTESIPPVIYDNTHVIRSLPDLIEFIPNGVNKAVGLEFLGQRLGIPRENIFAIGDEHNDVEMLDYAGFSVAMGNASDLVKSRADAVTDDNEHNGMAKALEKYVLK